MKTVHIMIFFLGAISLLNNGYSEETNYFPLGNAAQWTYSVNIAGGGNNRGKLVVRIDGTEEINGTIYVKAKYIFSDNLGIPNWVQYYRKTDDAVMFIDGRLNSKKEQKYLNIPPLPPERSFSWKIKQPVGNYVEEFIRKEARFEDLQVMDPSGNLKEYKNCLVIESREASIFPEYEATEYYAPNIGLVRQIEEGVSISLDNYVRAGEEPEPQAELRPAVSREGSSPVKQERPPADSLSLKKNTLTEEGINILLRKALEDISERHYVSPPDKDRNAKKKTLQCLNRAIENLGTAGEIALSMNINMRAATINGWKESLMRAKVMFEHDDLASLVKSYDEQKKILKEMKQYLEEDQQLVRVHLGSIGHIEYGPKLITMSGINDEINA